MIGHAVGGGGASGILSGAATAAFIVAVIALVAVSRRRGACLVAAVAAVLGGILEIVSVVVAAPQPPQYHLALSSDAVPSPVGHPLSLRLCARYPDGSTTGLPLGGSWLDVSVDGRLRQEVQTPEIHLDVADGSHQLSVELVTSDHRAYAAPVRLTREVTVARDAPPYTPPRCPSS